MPCNMPSKGERIQLLIANGDKSVKEILQQALSIAGNADVAKLESLLELEQTVLFYSHVMNGRIVSACVEKAGEKISGHKAIQYLKDHLNDTPLTGYIEVSKITKGAYELDVESEPEAKLDPPLEPQELLEAGGEEEKLEAPAERGGEETTRVTETTGAAKVEEEVPLSQEKLDNPGLVDELELANMMVYLLTKSEIIMQARDPHALLSEAKKNSSGDVEAFYRVAVEFENGEVYNVFYHKGRLCNLIRVMAEGFRAQALQQVSERELEKILGEGKGKVRRAILYRVLCPECAKVVLRNCPEAASELYERGKREKEEREKEVRRRFRLLGFLRRR